MATAVVELQPLADTVRPAAKDDDFLARRRIGFAFLLERAVHIRREGLELGGAGIDPLVSGTQTCFDPGLAHGALVAAKDHAEVTIAEPCALERPQQVRRHAAQAYEACRPAELDDLRELRQEPRIDLRELVNLLDGPPAVERAEDGPHPAIGRNAQVSLQRRLLVIRIDVRVAPRLTEQRALGAQLERAERLHERFLERPANRHHLAHRLHLRRQRAIGAWELLECPPRHLDDDVVDCRFEGSRRQPGDVVGNLVEVISERELGGNLRDREAGGLRRERRRTRHARIHLDDDDPAVRRIDRELDVRAAGLHADAADDPPREIAHALVLTIREGQSRRHRDAVAGVHAHRIDVFDRADDHEVVGPVAHDLELELLPADHRLFEQHFVDGAEIDTSSRKLAELLDVVGDAAADAAERERRANDRGKPDVFDGGEGFVDAAYVAALGHVRADRPHRLPKQQPILGNLDCLDRRADQLDAVFLQNARLAESDREIQRRLTADGRQDGLRFFLRDDRLEHLGRQGLDVGAVGELRVGHDRRRIAVDEDDFQSLGTQRFAGLSTRVVELAGLTDDDRTRTDDEDALDVCTLWHSNVDPTSVSGNHTRFSISSMN